MGEIQSAIAELKKKLSEANDFFEKLEIKDQILELEYKSGIKEKPKFRNYECIGCGS